MTNREKEILEIIRNNPQISQNDIAKKLNITRSSVGGHIANLIEKGYIVGRGYIISNSDYIVIIGGADVDIVGKPFNKLIEKDSNPGKITYSVGGVGRNIAENLAKLKVDTRLLTAIGNDRNGDLIKENAMVNNIDIQHSIFSDSHETATYLAIL
ncbi:MAG: winged helix-turn-helix transcriptional regulator, partial [Tissierellia bacterium]|nr:winged helix-turn-helix transcriptional regulator [Tissierellia bacterium]